MGCRVSIGEEDEWAPLVIIRAQYLTDLSARALTRTSHQQEAQTS